MARRDDVESELPLEFGDGFLLGAAVTDEGIQGRQIEGEIQSDLALGRPLSARRIAGPEEQIADPDRVDIVGDGSGRGRSRRWNQPTSQLLATFTYERSSAAMDGQPSSLRVRSRSVRKISIARATPASPAAARPYA